MGILESIISAGNTLLWTYVLIFLLIGLGVYFTVRSNFVQFRMIGEMVRLLASGTRSRGGVSSFGAFAVGTAARVGTGNLAGVALAIAVGGPGAVFWMWVIALVGAASAFVESTLAQVYKVRDGDTFRGGPAYYMERALGQRWMGLLFAALITVTFGLVFNSVQANTISLAFSEAYGTNRLLLGLVLAAISGAIIFGGIKRIARAAEVLVVVLAVPYVLMALYVILANFTEIPRVLALIVGNAFGLTEVAGGGLGAALLAGVQRGLFSNEAGMGSAPNAAATANVSHPVKQGLVQSLGVFVDTLLICSATAFIILFSGIYEAGDASGIELTQQALSAHIGGWASAFLAFAVFTFAFSSIIANYYYGETNIQFITGDDRYVFYYRLAVLGLVVFGSVAALELVWAMADLFMGSMALVNLIAIGLLGRIAFAALNDYTRQRRTGRDPTFHTDSIPGLRNTEAWGKPDRVR
ncbi:alanine:cation symporter family protein [Rubrobacter taiwanensis]|uniref:Alanine:cation symporter family protein n=1 Tax=Rubrobacter taiwanensis TaxID=185139 RepID=A0A4R1BLJ9_9ACTN|nr:alanine/glycine:cation symporter family protein [Rubrobacter taiwanensis]TCJ18305.1 alanine:cation symporter family protein [Rubrobacter taiwanensis]